ncbi:MAG: TlpA family protein disulfide reductase [Bradymonadia bacterium]
MDSLKSLQNPFLIFALFWLHISCGGQQRGGIVSDIADAKIASPLPIEMTFRMLDGKQVKLSELRDSVVIVSYFTSSCAPCAELLPELNRLQFGRNAIPNLVVVAVSLDEEAQARLPVFIESWGLDVFMAVADENTMNGQTPFGQLVAVPTTYLIDPKGVYSSRFVGSIPTAHLRRKLSTLGAIDDRDL